MIDIWYLDIGVVSHVREMPRLKKNDGGEYYRSLYVKNIVCKQNAFYEEPGVFLFSRSLHSTRALRNA